MLFFKGKEDMGLDASLKLLDLSPDATIDDANQAYTYLHRMIDLFHQDAADGKRGNRQEDMDLLTCAYEKAIAYISDRDPQCASTAGDASRPPSSAVPQESRNLHFTINFPAGGLHRDGSSEIDARLPEPNERTVDDAISITARRMQETEAALPAAQKAVESAMAAAAESSRRHEQARQARLNAIVAAKSAKSRALLLEVEAQRAMQEAIDAAQKARERVAAARQAAGDARVEADQARERAGRVAKSEETAAAEVICAEDRLEKEKARLKALTHALIRERDRMRLFRSARGSSPTVVETALASLCQCADGSPEMDHPTPDRQQIMADLLAIESSLQSRSQRGQQTEGGKDDLPESTDSADDRRRHPRIVYPSDQRPLLRIEGREIPVVDLSTTGMGLAPDGTLDGLRIVRGAISLGGRQPVRVAGRVVRQDERGSGLKLVTRIGDHLLDQELLRLRA